MPFSRQLRCAAYAMIALLAFVGTGKQALGFIPADRALFTGFAAGTRQFWVDALSAPAGTFLTVDVFLLGLAVVILMVVEARQLGIPYVWAYVLLGLVVAISVTVPLFLLARERRLAARGDADTPARLAGPDAALLAALTAGIVAVTLWTIVR